MLQGLLAHCKPILDGMAFKAHEAKLEQDAIHVLHFPFELRESLVHFVTFWLLDDGDSHELVGNHVDKRSVL